MTAASTSTSICEVYAATPGTRHVRAYTGKMRFLRMLTNSLMAGALGAAYLTVLVLQLNPHIPVLSATTWRWFATLSLLYGVHLAVTFYVVIVVREFFMLRVLSLRPVRTLIGRTGSPFTIQTVASAGVSLSGLLADLRADV